MRYATKVVNFFESTKYWRADVLNKEFLKDTEGNRQGYPKRTYSAGMFLNGYSDHFPTEILLMRKVERKK